MRRRPFKSGFNFDSLRERSKSRSVGDAYLCLTGEDRLVVDFMFAERSIFETELDERDREHDGSSADDASALLHPNFGDKTWSLSSRGRFSFYAKYEIKRPCRMWDSTRREYVEPGEERVYAHHALHHVAASKIDRLRFKL